MSRKRLMAPAIRLARKGYTLDAGDVKILHERSKDFAQRPNVAKIFLNHSKPYQAGHTLKQPQLAQTLSLISQNGTKAFYEGSIAKSIVAASKVHGGLLSMADFANYTAPWGAPITCGFAGYTVLSTPPPSSGGTTICEILGILSPLPLSRWSYGSVQETHDLIDAERRAFADRNTYLGDPAFVDNPIGKLLSESHLSRLRSSIDPHKATPSAQVQGSLGAAEGQHTTQFSVVEAHGNTVSVTYTINYLFGSGILPGVPAFS